MNPVMVTLHRNAGYSRILQRLQDLDGTGKGTWQDLTGMKEVSGNKNKINRFINGALHNGGEHDKKVFIPFQLSL